MWNRRHEGVGGGTRTLTQSQQADPRHLHGTPQHGDTLPRSLATDDDDIIQISRRRRRADHPADCRHASS